MPPLHLQQPRQCQFLHADYGKILYHYCLYEIIEATLLLRYFVVCGFILPEGILETRCIPRNKQEWVESLDAHYRRRINGQTAFEMEPREVIL
jgi:hypothetical protein